MQRETAEYCEAVTADLPDRSLRESLSGPHLLLLAGVLLVALNLRNPLIAVSTVTGPIRSDLNISSGTAGLLTSLPVLCFGLATPIAFAVIAKVGAHRAVLLCLGGVAVATALRSAGGISLALSATVVLGIAITIGNVVVPVLIGQDFASAAVLVTGAYTAAFNVGSMLSAALTVPIADLIGWRLALVSWGLLAVVAAAVWLRANSTARTVAVRERRPEPAPRGDGPRRPVWRRKRVWALTLAFGCQAFSYYSLTAWLPTLLADERGMSTGAAGASASIFQIVAVAGSFSVPLLASRGVPQRVIFLMMCGFWVLLPAGLLLAPAAWPLWAACGGIAQGGGITVIFVAIVAFAADTADSRALSAFVQGGGYVVGAIGPYVLGALHDLSDGWTLPLSVVLIVVVAMAFFGVSATSAKRAALP